MKSLKLLVFNALLTLALLGGGQMVAYAEQSDFTAAELDQMLAPIALYPDTVLSHILIASTYPLEIVQADRWARENPGLEGEAAVAAVEDQDWEPSVKALVAFPQVLQRMSEDLAWTQRLGDAFLDDEAQVMDSIQNLRNKAYASGSLDKLEHVRVQRDKEVIIIEPAVERVVYVPVYDTRVVYGNWWWSDYPPVYWHYPGHVTFVGGFYWGPRIYVGPSFYFSSFHWHRHQVVYLDRYRHRQYFHTGRSIANYSGAQHWRHNPSHRRGVAYHSERTRQHYGSNRQSYTAIHQQRGTQPQLRREQQLNNNIRRSHEQGNQARTDMQRPGSTGTGARSAGNVQRESDRVRERLANPSREQRTGGTLQRPGSGSNQQNRARDSESAGAQLNPRGNTTLPSQNDPRPNVNREPRSDGNQGVRRDTIPDAQRAQTTRDINGAAPQQPRTENRPTQQSQPRSLTSSPGTVRERSQGLDRTIRQPQVSRPSTQNRGRPMNSERSSR